MDREQDRVVELFATVAFCEKRKFKSIKYKKLPENAQKAVETALTEWNLTLEQADDIDVQKVTLGKKETLFVVSMSGCPAEEFHADLIVDDTDVVGKSIRVSQ